MIHIKKLNFTDAEAEYEYITSVLPDENGFTNDYFDADRDDFKLRILPTLINHSKGIDLPDGYVPETHYMLWDDDIIVGWFRLRHFLCENLVNGAGHIGYSIKESYRRRGYATRGLELLIREASGIIPEDEIFLRVNKNNPASLSVMLKNGGYIHHEDDKKYYVRIKNKTRRHEMIFTDITRIGDPQVILYNGKYYCYATHGADGFDVWESNDLENWNGPHRCFDAAKSWGKSHFWAPEVVYHNGKFVMHYTAMSREMNSLRLGVAVSDSPTGPFHDVHDAPMFDFGYAAIDGSVLISDAGNYLYFSRDCSENVKNGVHTSEIYCIELDDTLTKTIGTPELMTTPTDDYEILSKTNPACENFIWNEGPTVIKLGEKYVMNYSTNFYASNDYAICLAVSDSPKGPWIKSAKNPVLSRNAELFGTGHNAFFYSKDGELMTSFHIQTNPEKPSGNRRTVIGKVIFTEENGEIWQTIE